MTDAEHIPVDLSDTFSQGLPDQADIDTKRKFAKFCYENYVSQQWKGSSLSEFFADDFIQFSIEDFRSLDANIRRNLRDHLRRSGVYVPKGRNVQIANALHAVVENELSWPIDDPERPLESEVNGVPNVQERPHESSTKSQDTQELIDAEARLQTTATSIQDSDEQRIVPNRRSNLPNLFKAYHGNTDRYSGSTTDNFDRKLAIFHERCEQSGIFGEERRKAFSIMLCSAASQFYFDQLQGKGLSLAGMAEKICSRFQTAERTRALLREWESLSLPSIMTQNQGKSATFCLETLINRLSEIQVCLPMEYRNDTIFKNKLLNAVKDVESCRLAYQKPAPSLQGIISDLHASIATASSANTLEPTAFYIDRKYHKRNKGSDKICYVCKQKGCWSTNHTTKERLEALKRNKTVRQFLTDVSTEDQSDQQNSEEMALDEIENITAHIIDIDSQSLNNEPLRYIQDFDNENCPGQVSTFTSNMTNSITIHALTGNILQCSRYNSDKFHGILVDTGAARGSTSSESQYVAYCQHVGQKPQIKASKTTCLFGIGKTESIGTAIIQFPVGKVILSFTVHIVKADIPMLLCLQDMDNLGIHFNNLTNRVTHENSKQSTLVTRQNGHPFIEWNPLLQCFFTEQELRRLHRRFGHPSTDKLMNFLKRADENNLKSNTRSILQNIVKSCTACQLYAQKPRRFKFTIRENKEFNHTVYVDIFYIDNHPILHVVDEATNYQAAKWLRRVNTESVWKALKLCWIDVYIGPPEVIAHDAGKNFMSKEFQANAHLFDIKTKPIPVECPHSMTVVERYHAPIRRAYKIIRKEAPNLEKESALQTAVKSVNDSVGPNGLIPTLLVYGALPRLGFPSDPPTPSMYQRAVALQKATNEMSKYFAKSQINGALRCRNGPDTTNIHLTPIGSKVLVYRDRSKKWEGPFPLLGIDGETCTVSTHSGPTRFRTTVVKRFYEPSTSHNDTSTTPHLTVYFKSSCIPVVPADRFYDSRMNEVNNLLDRGVFEYCSESDATGYRIFGSRFVDTVKYEGTADAFEKSRLVVQAYKDKKHGLLTYSPTVQRASQRLLLCCCAIDQSFTFFTRDVSQAYVQSTTPVQRPIFIRPPTSLKLSKDILFRVKKPLYGLPEAGVHWFKTYHAHFTAKLGMKPAIHDLCFLYKQKSLAIKAESESLVRGITCLQTDDTGNAGNDSFMKMEEVASKQFDCKPATPLKEGERIRFNGAFIGLDNGEYTVTQQEHIQKLNFLSETSPEKDAFTSERARGAYIAAICRPDLCYGFSVASQVVEPGQEDVKFLNRHIRQCVNRSDMGLKFVKLEQSSVRLAVFADAGFATNKDKTSQLGYVITLMDGNSNANIIHYGSCKAKRVARSVLSAELLAIILSFDIASTIRIAVNDIFGKQVPMQLFTDSRCLYDCLVSLGSTTEKRMLIDLQILRQAYERREICEFFWIPTAQNPADAFTKERPTPALQSLLQKNSLSLTPNAWVDRPLLPIWPYSHEPRSINS